jgi:predicted phage terminase large subunit-like protein
MTLLLKSDELRNAVFSDLAGRLTDCVIRRSEDQWRRLRLVDWGRCLLPAYFRLPPSKMHLWLSDELDRLGEARGTRLNALGPRGSAKSTLGTLAYVLRSAVEGREPYVWIVSDTIDQARTHLSHVKAELEQNELLQAYYPKSSGRGNVWRRDAIELPSGTMIEAYSTGQHLRGRRRRQHRPSLIVCDDLQNDKNVLSPMQRQASRDWFHSALLKAGDGRTNVVNFATALHRDALAMELNRSPGWRSKLFKAIEEWPERMDLWSDWEEFYIDAENPDARELAWQFFEENRNAMEAGAELLWPEHQDLYSLMRMRVEEGRTAFEREKQNSPVDPEKCEWPEEYFGHHIWFEQWPQNLRIKVVALDPSKGADSRHGDYSAYVLLGIDAHGVHYVEADLARRPTPEMVHAGALICHRFNPQAFGVEANLYQQLLIREFEEAFKAVHTRFIKPRGIENTTSKVVRIRLLGPLLSQHRLRFHAKSPSTRLLVDQLRDFPQGSHDDGPDALEMAIRLAETMLSGDTSRDDGLGSNLIAKAM